MIAARFLRPSTRLAQIVLTGFTARIKVAAQLQACVELVAVLNELCQGGLQC